MRLALLMNMMGSAAMSVPISLCSMAMGDDPSEGGGGMDVVSDQAASGDAAAVQDEDDADLVAAAEPNSAGDNDEDRPEPVMDQPVQVAMPGADGVGTQEVPVPEPTLSEMDDAADVDTEAAQAPSGGSEEGVEE